MSQDIISDALNNIMNAKNSGKSEISVNRFSKLLLKILDIAEKSNYIEGYKINKKKLEIKIGELNNCKAIKPRFTVTKSEINKYLRRYLPAKDMGIMLISTNKGLMTHEESLEKNLGGCLIAYFY